MAAADDQIGLLIDRLPRNKPDTRRAILRRLDQLHRQADLRARQEADAKALELEHRRKFTRQALRWANVATVFFFVLIAASGVTSRAWSEASALLVALIVASLWRHSRMA